jgi:peptidoglycan/LPS O-acetylase OafA/YrhL
MFSMKIPRLYLLTQSNLAQDSYHSHLMSLLRGLAAIQVAAAHLRSEVFPGLGSVADPSIWYLGLAFATGFAHQAVLIFFLISGWLVGGSLLNKIAQPHAFKVYAIDRITRLWTVLIPTFGLMLLLGIGTDVLSPHAIDYSSANEYSVFSFLGNLLGLQTVTVPNFGGNYSLWSLANETWYYVLFPLLLLVFTSRTLARRALGAAAIILIAAFLPYPITLYFSLWLLGVAFSRIRLDCGNGVRIGLFVLLAATSVYYRLTGINDDLAPKAFVQDLVCSLVFLLFLSSMHIKTNPASKLLKPASTIGKLFSEFSFTLYVTHLPLIALMQHGGATWFGRNQLSPHALPDLGIYAGMLLTIVAGSYLSYLLFESQTYRIRRLVKNLVLQRVSSAAPAPARGLR